jgi:hypothetical protein
LLLEIRKERIIRLETERDELVALAEQIAAQDPITYPADERIPVKQLCNLINEYQKQARAALAKVNP